MHVHPTIEALRSDPASQRRAQVPFQRAVAHWRANEGTRAIAAALEAYGNGAPLAQCSALDALLTDHEAALDWVRDWSTRLIGAIRQEPLSNSSFGFHCSDAFATIQLMTSGFATLALTVHYRKAERVEPNTALLVDRESTELLLAGSARALFHRFEDHVSGGSKIYASQRDWRAGERIELMSDCARHLIEADQSLLVLQLTRSSAAPRPTRKFSLPGGRLLKTASGDKQASRDLMALAVLGAMDHDPGLDLFGDIALDEMRDRELRWDALRYLLASDTARGFDVLSDLSGRPADPLAPPARRLRSQLLAAHPQLATLLPKAA